MQSVHIRMNTFLSPPQKNPGTAYDAPYQILVLSSGVWWSLLLDIRCLWHHNMRSYSRFQSNVLAKLLTQSAYHSTPPVRCFTMCHCNEHKLSALKVRRKE